MESPYMRTSLELFVFAMLQQGIASPYELKTNSWSIVGQHGAGNRPMENDGLVRRRSQVLAEVGASIVKPLARKPMLRR